MIDFPIKAEVYCSDGIVGISTYIIGDPVKHQVTHLVVKSSRPPFQEYLVPVDEVDETKPDLIKLKCTRAEMAKMDLFEYQEYMRTEYQVYKPLSYTFPGATIRENVVSYVPVKQRNIPQGELAVRRGAKVEATDGYAGRVDELLINSNDKQPAFLILRENHIFTRREITIPVSQIERVEEDTIYLKLDRKSIEELPTAPIERWQLQKM